MQIVMGNGTLLGNNGNIAGNFFQRLKGLAFRNDFAPGEFLLIKPCKIIHTFGLRFSIDVVFISSQKKVVALIGSLRPNRISPLVPEAASVLELPGGTITKTGLKKGDLICII